MTLHPETEQTKAQANMTPLPSVSPKPHSSSQSNDVSDTRDEDRGIIVNANDMTDDLLPSSRKKKKRSKPASKRGLGKPTGFEEFHADAPLTLEQVAESKEAFNQNVPFVDRILKAIQRFERTRKLSPERRDVFYKYLAYGGVDVGPNMFVGAVNTENMDKDEIDTAMAQANISDETKQAIINPKQQEESGTNEGSRLRSSEHLAKYVIDFEGTMRGFLSRHATELYVFDTVDRVDIVTTTLERFMDYLLQHEVCPEYSEEVLSTRNLCRVARAEMWNCAEAQRHLPGAFNIACSTLFGGYYYEDHNQEPCHDQEEPDDKIFTGLKPEKATQIVGFAVAGAASEDVYSKYLEVTTGKSAGKGFEIINVIRDNGFEIMKVEKPTTECLELYKENTSDFYPVGKVYAKFFQNPDAPPEDLTPAEKVIQASNQYKEPESAPKRNSKHDYIFFVESDPLLTLLQPGIRIEATIYELNCGIWFFDEATRVLPSFDLWLENELMQGWKEPKPIAGAPEYAWNGGSKDVPELTDSVAVEPPGDDAMMEKRVATVDVVGISEVESDRITEEDHSTLEAQSSNIFDNDHPY